MELSPFALFDDLIDPVKRAAADEKNIRRIDLDELLMRVLASALRRHAGNRTLDNFEQRLLHAFAGNIARDRRILALTGNLVDFVDIDDTALGRSECRSRHSESGAAECFPHPRRRNLPR